jgi:hypothetical protein
MSEEKVGVWQEFEQTTNEKYNNHAERAHRLEIKGGFVISYTT